MPEQAKVRIRDLNELWVAATYNLEHSAAINHDSTGVVNGLLLVAGEIRELRRLLIQQHAER